MQPITQMGLTVQVSNIRQRSGKLFIAVYDRSASYMREDQAILRQAYPVLQQGTQLIELTQLSAGDYAIACFHDLNDNGRLDTNMLGIPTEPYGCSNNVRPTFRPASWEEAKFSFAGQLVEIRLEKW